MEIILDILQRYAMLTTICYAVIKYETIDEIVK